MKYYEFETTKYPISHYLAKEDYLITRSEECFFIWNNLPAVVIGKNQVLATEVNLNYATEKGIKIYRRKSGGGAIYTDDGCFMYTFIVKKDSIENIYNEYLTKMCKALNSLGIKAQVGGRNDILVDGAKVSGTAICLKGKYAIFHGTMLYDANLDEMEKILTPSNDKLKSNGVKSIKSRVTNLAKYTNLSKYELMEAIQKRIGNIKGRIFESEEKVIEKMAEKYNDPAFIEGVTIPFTYKTTKRFPKGEITFMAKVSRKIMEEVKISGDFFETYDIAPLCNCFVDVKFERNAIEEVIDNLIISRYIYGVSNQEFKELFAELGEKKKVELHKTCLYENHLAHGAKIVEFGGFLMPLEYSGITPEHHAVRNNAGLFDCSHMGEIAISGRDTIPFLNYLLTSNIEKAPALQMTYGLLLYKNGCVVDDLMVYKINDTSCMLVVNASNTKKDYEYICDNKGNYNVTIKNQSAKCGQLALQGPKAIEYLRELTDYDLDELKYSHFDYFKINGDNFNVSRSGYTGSDGFEIYGEIEDIKDLFEKLASMGVTLCGLGCRDTLRFEAAMPLYGHEISDQITPLEAGLSFAVDFSKKDFIGMDALVKQKKQGLKRRLVGIELLERGIARGDYKLFVGEEEVGYVTTGYMIPETNNAYALGFVNLPYNKIGTEIEVQIRNRNVKAVVRDKKFLNKEYAR